MRSPNSEGELGSSVGGSNVRRRRKTEGLEGFRGREGIISIRKGESEIGELASRDWLTREVRSGE